MKISVTITALLFAIAAGTFKPVRPLPKPQKQTEVNPLQDTLSMAISSIEMEIKNDIQKARTNAHKNTVAVKKMQQQRQKERNCCIWMDSIHQNTTSQHE